MMESVAFNESNLIEEEDYVLVHAGESNMSMNSNDEVSYEDDGDFVIFSLPSTGNNLGTNENLKEENLGSSVISSEGCKNKFGEEIDDLLMKLEKSPGDHLIDNDEVESNPSRTDENETPTPSVINPKEIQIREVGKSMNFYPKETNTEQESIVCGSRLSNKKRRKRLKMMKKAAAAAEAAASLEAMRRKVSLTPVVVKSTKKGKIVKTYKVNNHAKLAVICATESLSEYREKHCL